MGGSVRAMTDAAQEGTPVALAIGPAGQSSARPATIVEQTAQTLRTRVWATNAQQVVMLGPLDHEPELIETLDAFFAADCSPSTTACQLSIHRNILNYRLDKGALLTGLDPRHFDQAVQIRLALLLRSLLQ
jgi:DNA-binding PucR family transcriptional regulator